MCNMKRVGTDGSVELDSICIEQNPMLSEYPTRSDQKLQPQLTTELPILSISTRIQFTREKAIYRLQDEYKLKNSLLAAVGYLELANAGDFAANVWNDYPVPKYAIALMAIGGSFALFMVIWAVKDCILGWANVKGLRAERRSLLARQARLRRGSVEDRAQSTMVDALLDVNFRELGTESVDRVGMDMCMGFGSLLVGVGTLLAIGGSDPKIFLASNLLSGYIGNTPCAIYGLSNLVWSVIVWKRARKHQAAKLTFTGARARQVRELLQKRTRSLQFHATCVGIMGLVGSAGSLVTATMPLGYAPLVPCIIASILLNRMWRHRLGYDRPYVHDSPRLDEDAIVNELFVVQESRTRAMDRLTKPFANPLFDPESITGIIEFLLRYQLFDKFCLKVLADTRLRPQFLKTESDAGVLEVSDFIHVQDAYIQAHLLQIARKLASKANPRCFDYRERYLLEVLGAYLCARGDSTE